MGNSCCGDKDFNKSNLDTYQKPEVRPGDNAVILEDDFA